MCHIRSTAVKLDSRQSGLDCLICAIFEARSQMEPYLIQINLLPRCWREAARALAETGDTPSEPPESTFQIRPWRGLKLVICRAKVDPPPKWRLKLWELELRRRREAARAAASALQGDSS